MSLSINKAALPLSCSPEESSFEGIAEQNYAIGQASYFPTSFGRGTRSY